MSNKQDLIYDEVDGKQVLRHCSHNHANMTFLQGCADWMKSVWIPTIAETPIELYNSLKDLFLTLLVVIMSTILLPIVMPYYVIKRKKIAIEEVEYYDNRRKVKVKLKPLEEDDI